MLFNALRRYSILILCAYCVCTLQAQKRFQISDKGNYLLTKMLGFTVRDANGEVDQLLGLHASQYVGAHHLLGGSLEGAWTSFANNMPIASIQPGGGALGLHFVYEFQYSGLLIQTGIGINFQHVYTNVQDTDIYHYHMQDNWEYIESADYTLKHEFRQRRDLSRNMYVQVPLYVGQYIFGGKGVGYWLGGFHVNCAYKGETRQNVIGTTMALYEPYLGVWHEMDNHGYRKDVPIERKGERLNLNLDIMLHGESGYETTTWRTRNNYRTRPGDRVDCRMRFAAFADFGLLNICPRSNNVLYGIPVETIYDFPTYRMDHVFSTVNAKAYWMRNVYVGFRFTVLFGIPWKDHCILCDSWRL